MVVGAGEAMALAEALASMVRASARPAVLLKVATQPSMTILSATRFLIECFNYTEPMKRVVSQSRSCVVVASRASGNLILA
jgi:hypothetical protein